MGKERISITIDAALVKQLKALAKSEERTFSNYINKVLIDHLENEKRKKQLE